MYMSATLIGRISKEINLKYIKETGTALCEFDVAVERKINNNKSITEYYPVQIWGKYGETLSNKLEKGQLVFIVGEGKNERWIDKEDITHKKFTVITKFLKIIDYNNHNLCSLNIENLESSLIESTYQDRVF
ncbi:MAG: single-stranded DNA-binding protein [Paeniclostridium sordellii]|uniref:single-stranded DNA-binding protein n=1 Tax=Paraclostridium sordellii TaxID=1505 RepID=UPI000E4A13AA|nr:single-stranded DNA-binding protein [Paeniclostridium sordellii]MDU6482990.1 single-stranded DNA-binding protein [Paeniclostridium sordellii]RGX06267.1 single-stranded DNA-binding protein [Paeniclostridium sordellii]